MSESVRQHILLVEDEAILAMSEKMQLEMYGYAVRTVTTGEKAVEAVAASSDIDLILMDINLGKGIDGTEAAEIILNDRDIPIVFLSSHTDPEVVEKTEKITSYGYVVKNSSATVLDASIKMAFRLFHAKVEEQKKEEALRQSEARFRVAQEVSPDGFTIFEPVRNNKGEIVDFTWKYQNSAIARINGTDPKEVIGKQLLHLFPDHRDTPIFEAYLNVAKTGKTQVLEDISVGNILSKPMRLRLVVVSMGTDIAILAQDITQLKESEEELERFKILSDNAVYGNAIADLQGNLLYVNRFFANIHGYEPAELTGKHLSVFHNEQQLEAVERLNASVMQTGSYVPTTVWHCHKDGTEFPMLMSGILLKDDDGNPQYIAASAVDITERKQAEDALHHERNLLRSIIDSIPDPIYVKNTEARKQIVNKADCDTCGFESKKDLIGMSDLEIYPPEIARSFIEDDEKVLKHGERVVNREEQLIMPNGEMVWQLTTKLPMYDQEGKITGLLGIGRDITVRKHAEQEIQKQLLEKETLLREGHHRVKNNIATIESLLSLQIGESDSTEVKGALQEAVSRVQSIRILYDKLLISEDLDEIGMRNYAESLLAALFMVFDPDRNITVETDIADFEVESGKAISIGIIINELLTNVFKYAFRDGDGGKVSLAIAKKEGHVTLTVQDDGVGIDENTVEKKLGFGLTIVEMLAEQLGGTIRFKNDNGTQVTVAFPITDEP